MGETVDSYHLKPSSFASVTGITHGAGSYASYLPAKFYHIIG